MEQEFTKPQNTKLFVVGLRYYAVLVISIQRAQKLSSKWACYAHGAITNQFLVNKILGCSMIFIANTCFALKCFHQWGGVIIAAAAFAEATLLCNLRPGMRSPMTLWDHHWITVQPRSHGQLLVLILLGFGQEMFSRPPCCCQQISSLRLKEVEPATHRI